jgi:hypothetical protein
MDASLRHRSAAVEAAKGPPARGASEVQQVTAVGLDLAKHVFQLHGADAEDRRLPPLARELLRVLAEHLRALEERTAEVDRRLVAMARGGR